MTNLDNYYFGKSEPNRGCLLALRSLIFGVDKEINETIKYGMPCFCFRGKMFCYLWTDKKPNSRTYCLSKAIDLSIRNWKVETVSA